MDILITGINGRIGSGIYKKIDELFGTEDNLYFLRNISPLSLTKSNLNQQEVTSLKRKYDLAIHLAAKSDIDFCEKNKNEAIKNNVELTKRVCNFADKVILMSTDLVFKGDLKPGESYKETDITDPINFYGQTKAESEKIVLKNKGAVIRIQTMMGVQNKIIENAKKIIEGKKTYPPWNNYFLKPTYFEDYFNVLKKIVKTNKLGIFHVACNGKPLSRAEMVQIGIDYHQKNTGIKIGSLETELCEKTKIFDLNTDWTRERLGLDNFIQSGEAIRKHLLEGYW